MQFHSGGSLASGISRWMQETAQRFKPSGGQDDLSRLADVREALRFSAARLRSLSGSDGVSRDDNVLQLDGREIRVRRYRPQASTDRLMIYFHGGGWVAGDLDTHDSLIGFLSRECQCEVASIDYRLAPEHSFEAICADAHDATVTLVHRAAAFGQRVAIAGDSAGGYLAALSAMAAPTGLSAVLLLYPAIRPDFSTRSYVERGDGLGLTADGMQWFWRQFLQTGARAVTNPDLTSIRLDRMFPPCIILRAWHDPLHDDSLALSEHLQTHGTMVIEQLAGDMPHGFARYVNVDPNARQYLVAAARALDSLW